MEELHGAIKHLGFVIDLHRKHAFRTCPGDCWCWAADAVCTAYERGIESATPDLSHHACTNCKLRRECIYTNGEGDYCNDWMADPDTAAALRWAGAGAEEVLCDGGN